MQVVFGVKKSNPRQERIMRRNFCVSRDAITAELCRQHLYAAALKSGERVLIDVGA